MASKSEKDRAKQIQDRCQNILMQMLKDEDNKYCVDCDAKGPRWASWNLGIFLCIRCAGIHRNLGVHISKVKSVNLDSWTPEQVVSLQQMGNSRARAVYEANLPDSFRRPQNDSSLEAFIRAKYETRKYIAKEWVQPPPPKVNWDKEIDEEIEKLKKKKKSSSSSGVGPLPAPALDKYNKSDVIPSIPKPKSSVSPKLGRSIPQTQPEPSKPSNGAADLLGLDTSKPDTKPSDDIFSSFFSASDKPAETKPVETKPDLKTEEENFFKQAAPTASEKSKLTKDSILALYSQTPATNLGNANQFSGQSYPYPYQGFSSAQPQNGMQAAPFTNTQPQNGMPTTFSAQSQNIPTGFPSTQPPNGIQATAFPPTQPQNGASPFNAQQFNSAPSSMTTQFSQFQSSFQPAFPAQPQPGFQAFQQQPAFSQPAQQLNQQFGNMNIGNFPNFAQNSNVSWQ